LLSEHILEDLLFKLSLKNSQESLKKPNRINITAKSLIQTIKLKPPGIL
jgi:hypothetical protein